MLKFLTHKLRTHSLNEDLPHQEKGDDDHDSGTESDDEHGEAEDPESKNISFVSVWYTQLQEINLKFPCKYKMTQDHMGMENKYGKELEVHYSPRET
ncbi:hypothetical protein C0J52_03732 [Blattella germanica]|nr:hypothetical protein C0J52_03732 [Blattella germanica]